MKRALPGVVILLLAAATPGSQAPASAGDALIARARSLELNTPYVPPPGDPLETACRATRDERRAPEAGR